MHWLYQVIIAVVYQVSGEFGLVLSNVLLIVLSFAILYIRSKRDKNGTSNWQVLFFFAITSTAVFFETRPQILSWLFFNIMLLVLEDYYRGDKKKLFVLPIIMLIWTNTHTLFILGWVIIISYLISDVYRSKKLWTPLAKYGFLSIAVSIINPYFLKGIALPFKQFELLQPNNFFKNGIAELASPISFNSYFFNGRFVFLQPLMWFHIFLVISIIVFIFRLRKIQLHELLIFGLFIYLAVSSVRNIGFFVFAVLSATISGLQLSSNHEIENYDEPNLLERLLHSFNTLKAQTIVSVAIIILSVALMIAITTDVYYINYRSNDRFGYRFNNNILPVKASKFLVDNHLDGKILNPFNFGGYLIHALPQKIFIDDRTEVMGDTFFFQYSILWNQIDKKPILEKYNPQIIIFPYQNEFLWVHYLKTDALWRLVYVDELSAIYLRKGYADNIPALDVDKILAGYKKFDSLGTDTIIKTPNPSEYPLFKMTKQYFPLNELGISTFCYYNDQYDAAIQIGLNGLVRSTVACPEMYYNLGHYFFEEKDFTRSAYCYQRFLQTNTDALASERLKMIHSGKIEIWQDS